MTGPSAEHRPPPLDGVSDEVVPGSERHRIGMATRRAVLGVAHVERASKLTTDFDADFQTFITEGAWGSVWSRPGLTQRERSLITLALLAGLGHDDEVALHVRATRNTGASPADIAEAMLHVAVYAGVPAANHAIKIAKATLAAMAEEEKAASVMAPEEERADGR